MPRTCCVVMCGHSVKNCKMKRFPSDPVRARIWESNVGRPNWQRTQSSCVCECHFDPAQFEQLRQDGLKKLRHDAVPLVFPTHVLVVHDPAGENKWHTPKQGSQLSMKVKHNPVKMKSQTAIDEIGQRSETGEADHMYALTVDKHTQEDSIMCDSFCGTEVLDELGAEALSPSSANNMPQRIQNVSSDDKSTANLSPEKSTETRKRSSTLLVPQDPPAKLPVLQNQNEVQTTQQSSKVVQSLEKPVSHSIRQSQHSPSELLKSPYAPVVKQYSPSKHIKTSEASREISKLNAETDFPELFVTPEVWGSGDADDSTIDSPELLKDALSFLQFMLPQKWIAFSENSGIHVALLSKSRAKSIQRSVFVPLNGDKIELYVHAVKLSKDHEIFDGSNFKETQSLTHDSLGSFVDSIINIVQLFSSYDVCCGVTDQEYLLLGRRFNDCILDANTFGEEKYSQTVRSVACSLLAPKDGERCQMCETLYDD